MSIFRPSAHAEGSGTSLVISEEDPWWEPPSRSGPPSRSEPTSLSELPPSPRIFPRTEIDLDLTSDFRRTGTRRGWVTRGPVDVATSHLLLLRAFLAFAWLRAAFDKVADPSWWDGTVVTSFLTGGSGAEPLAGFQVFAEAILLKAPALIAALVLLAELTIGIGLMTGFRFDAALGVGIGLSMTFLAAGRINPAAFYLVIQLAMLGSPAGRVYRLDPWSMPRVAHWAPWAVMWAGSVLVWSVGSAGPLSTGSVAEPAAVLGFSSLFALLTIGLLWRREHRTVTGGA